MQHGRHATSASRPASRRFTSTLGIRARDMPIIKTEHASCSLRPWRIEDKADLVRNANSRKVWRNLTHVFPHPYTDEDAETWIAYANNCSPSTHLAIAINGRAVGGIGIIAGDGVSRRTGYFGYWLGEEHWGQGIATAAARAMVKFAVEHFAFVRLEAPVFAWNPASMRVLEKVGFVREGTLTKSIFKDSEVIDSVMYAYTTDA